MKSILLSIAIAASVLASADELKIEEKLLAAAKKALSASVDEDDLPTTIASGLWNSEKTALAVVHHRSKGSIVYIFIRQKTGEYLAVDASDVESGNFGKLGFKRTHYDRFKTELVEWMKSEDSKLQIFVRTRAWKNGVRYTASEPLLIASDGTVFWNLNHW